MCVCLCARCVCDWCDISLCLCFIAAIDVVCICAVISLSVLHQSDWFEFQCVQSHIPLYQCCLAGLLAKCAAKLLATGDRLGAVTLYRKANKATEAALLLAKLAEESGRSNADPLTAKKLQVISAA